MTPSHVHTIHHRHYGWDNSIAPVARIAPGESLEFEIADASGGQIKASSTVADVGRMDFGKVNPVTGPVFIDGAEPGDEFAVHSLAGACSSPTNTASSSSFCAAAGFRRNG